MHYHSLDDLQLLALFQKENDVKAFEELYHRHWFKLYSIALKDTRSKYLAEELTQEIFGRIWKNRNKGYINNLGAYLAVSLKHAISNERRRKNDQHPFSTSGTPAISGDSVEAMIDYRTLQHDLEKSLKVLPERTRDIFRQSRYENKTANEIAKDMDISQKTVEYHITKAIKVLKIRLRAYFNLFF